MLRKLVLINIVVEASFSTKVMVANGQIFPTDLSNHHCKFQPQGGCKTIFLLKIIFKRLVMLK
jgi:hypothetical protein